MPSLKRDWMAVKGESYRLRKCEDKSQFPSRGRSAVLKGLLNEEIIPPFLGERACRPMSPKQARALGKRHHSSDRSFQGRMIGVRKVSASHGAADDQIAADQ